jgi:hypothetical protein
MQRREDEREVMHEDAADAPRGTMDFSTDTPAGSPFHITFDIYPLCFVTLSPTEMGTIS